MSTTIELTRGARLFARSEPFALARGGELPELALPYELVGPAGAPVVLVQGGISADAHVAPSAQDPRPGWWNAIVGANRPIDTTHFRVLSLEFLGKREEAVVSSDDQALATVLLLDELRIGRLHAAIGASYGGMVALQLGARFPERVDRIVAISAPDRALPFATALRALQRRILALGRTTGAPREATAIARALGLVSYRSPAELDARFTGAPSRSDHATEDPFAPPFSFPVESWLIGKGRAFAARFDSAALARLSLAIDLHAVDVTTIRARTTLVGADPDLLVPPDQLESLAARCGGKARFVRLRSRYGHDAFLKEETAIGSLLAEALLEPVAALKAVR